MEHCQPTIETQPEHQSPTAVSEAGCHTRSLSLISINCISDSSIEKPITRYQCSSSSSEVLEKTARNIVYPLKPCYQPPERCVTPPGVPSFGTIEAQQLRLLPASRWSRMADMLAPRASWPLTPQQGHLQASSEQTQQISSTSGVRSGLGLEETLRRTMGGNCPVSAPAQPKPTRAKLPRSVFRAQNLGPLARAEDGTTVRGQWNDRVSAHGVGRRRLEQHPLVVNRRSAIEDIVNEIDKACAAAEREQAERVQCAETLPDHGLDLSGAASATGSGGIVPNAMKPRMQEGKTVVPLMRPPSRYPPALSSYNSFSQDQLAIRTTARDSDFIIDAIRIGSDDGVDDTPEPTNHQPEDAANESKSC